MKTTLLYYCMVAYSCSVCNAGCSQSTFKLHHTPTFPPSPLPPGKFAGMVASFCQRLTWADLEGLITRYAARVFHGVKPEVAALTEIPGVRGKRARALYKAGLRTVEEVAGARLEVVLEALLAGGGGGGRGRGGDERNERHAASKILEVGGGAGGSEGRKGQGGRWQGRRGVGRARVHVRG